MADDVSTNYTYRPRGSIGWRSYAAAGRNPSQMPNSLTEATKNPLGNSNEQGRNQNRGGIIIEDINQGVDTASSIALPELKQGNVFDFVNSMSLCGGNGLGQLVPEPLWHMITNYGLHASIFFVKRGPPVQAMLIKSFAETNASANAGSSTVDRGKSECFQTTACWIAAEHALRHARSNVSLISEIFDKWHIPKSEYVLLAGFDESLIKSGVGYLEQIHIFVSAEVDATSPLMSELGKLLSPFSSILFTDSSSYCLPVFKDDGSVWEFDELVYCTASKFADSGSSAKFPLTVISLSSNPDPSDGPTGFSQGSSGSHKDDKNSEHKSGKGKERDRGDEDEAGKDKEHCPNHPEQPAEGRTTTGPAEISFEILARIYPVEDEQKTFQTLTMHGNLTIKTAPLVQNSESRQFSKRHVQFMELTFDTESTTDTQYKQFHVRVVVDSQQENARINVIKPKRTRDSGGEEKRSTSTKTSRNRRVTASLTLGPHPLGTIAGAATKTNEVTTGPERKQYHPGITEHHRDGIVHWGFNVDDENFQNRGIDLQDDVLPTVSFEFVGDSNVPAPLPKSMDIIISSHWSTILPSQPKATWIRKLLRLGGSSGSTQATSYSNLFQIVVLKTEPSNLSESSHYGAKMKVMSGVSDQPEVKRPARIGSM